MQVGRSSYEGVACRLQLSRFPAFLRRDYVLNFCFHTAWSENPGVDMYQIRLPAFLNDNMQFTGRN